MTEGMKFRVFGELLTITEASLKFKVKRSTLVARMTRKNRTLEEAVSMPTREVSQDSFQWFGKELSLSAISRETGINITTLHYRLREAGMSIEEATNKKAQTPYGFRGSKEYNCWVGINQRCSNPLNRGYKNYGGRGIYMSTEFRDCFLTFYQHVGKAPSTSHSLDRIDNDKGYERGNLRWATQEEQCNNTRKNIRQPIYGEELTIAQAARKYKILAGSLGNRIRLSKESLEQAVQHFLDKRKDK